MAELTQDQIDALLRNEEIHIGTEEEKIQKTVDAAQSEVGQDAWPSSENAVAHVRDEAAEEIEENVNEYLTSDQIDAIGEIGNICMGTSATAMSSILGHRVIITTPCVKMFKAKNALAAYRSPFLAVSVGYLDGLMGKNLLILKDCDAAIITDVMMGGDGQIDKDNIVLTEIHLSAISEIMNQMIGSSATALSNMLKKPVNITPPEVQCIEVGGDVTGLMGDSEKLVRTSFDMEIEGILHSKLLQIMPLELAKNLADSQLNPDSQAKAHPQPESGLAPEPAKRPTAVPATAPPMEKKSASLPMVSVRPATYENFDTAPQGNIANASNLNLISDIPLEVTVELGRTHKSLQDVMNLGVGSIVVLDRLAGEMVDVIVNGKRIAKGEVVIIDENYGVRITEIFSGS